MVDSAGMVDMEGMAVTAGMAITAGMADGEVLVLGDSDILAVDSVDGHTHSDIGTLSVLVCMEEGVVLVLHLED